METGIFACGEFPSRKGRKGIHSFAASKTSTKYTWWLIDAATTHHLVVSSPGDTSRQTLRASAFGLRKATQAHVSHAFIGLMMSLCDQRQNELKFHIRFLRQTAALAAGVFPKVKPEGSPPVVVASLSGSRRLSIIVVPCRWVSVFPPGAAWRPSRSLGSFTIAPALDTRRRVDDGPMRSWVVSSRGNEDVENMPPPPPPPSSDAASSFLLDAKPSLRANLGKTARFVGAAMRT